MSLIQVRTSEEAVAEWRGWNEYRSHWGGLGQYAWDLAFATPEIAHHPLLNDVKVFALDLYTDQADPEPLPQHTPLLVEAIEALIGEREDMVAAITADVDIVVPGQRYLPDGGVTDTKAQLSTWMVNRDLVPRALWHVGLVKPARKGAAWHSGWLRFFFECPRNFVRYYLEEYMGTIGKEEHEIEGYILDRAALPLLVEWNRYERHAELVNEIMDIVFAAFTTYRHNEGLLVISRKIDLAAFQQRVQPDRLQQLADSLTRDEQQPYWEILFRLDRFAYEQNVEELGAFRAELGTFLGLVEEKDPAWAQRFQVAWAQLEQAYNTPISGFTREWAGKLLTTETYDLALVFQALDSLRAMIRSQILSLST